MKKSLKFVFIYSLSFFALCFTSNALCGGGKGGWNPFLSFCSRGAELEEVNSDNDSEDEVIDGAAAADDVDDSDGTSSKETSAEEIIEYLHKTSFNTKNINQHPNEFAMIQKSIVMIQPLMGDLNPNQLLNLLHSLKRLKAGLNKNLDLSKVTDVWIRCAQPGLIHYSFFNEITNIIMILADLGVTIDRNPEFEVMINYWIDKLQIKSSLDITSYKYTNTILMLGILRKNIRQDSASHKFINKFIMAIKSKLKLIDNTLLTHILLGLGMLKEKVDPTLDLSVFADEFIQRIQSGRLNRIICADLLFAIMGLEMLGKKVTELSLFNEKWYKSFQEYRLRRLLKHHSHTSNLRHDIKTLRRVVSSGDLEGLIDEGVFTRIVRLIGETGYPEEAREIYDIAEKGHIFVFDEAEHEHMNVFLKFLMSVIRERHGDTAIVPSMQRGEVTLWQRPDQRQVMMDYLAGDAWVVAADLPQPLNRMPTLQRVIRDFNQRTVANAIEQAPIEAILARVVWRGGVRRVAEKVVTRTNFPSTALWAWPAFLDPGV